jgi:hypothetical protein
MKYVYAQPQPSDVPKEEKIQVTGERHISVGCMHKVHDAPLCSLQKRAQIFLSLVSTYNHDPNILRFSKGREEFRLPVNYAWLVHLLVKRNYCAVRAGRIIILLH